MVRFTSLSAAARKARRTRIARAKRAKKQEEKEAQLKRWLQQQLNDRSETLEARVERVQNVMENFDEIFD